jgi:hypothetical protein
MTGDSIDVWIEKALEADPLPMEIDQPAPVVGIERTRKHALPRLTQYLDPLGSNCPNSKSPARPRGRLVRGSLALPIRRR